MGGGLASSVQGRYLPALPKTLHGQHLSSQMACRAAIVSKGRQDIATARPRQHGHRLHKAHFRRRSLQGRALQVHEDDHASNLGDVHDADSPGLSRSSSPEAKIAVAQKIRMARELARKLAAESAALAKAASLNIEAIEDESTAAEQWQQLQEEALFAAEEAAKVASDAAKSDAAVRNARKISAEKAVMAQLRKLRQENEALKAMVMEMAANKDEVSSRLSSLSEALGTEAATADAAAASDVAAKIAAAARKSEEEAEKAAAEARAADGLDEEITQVVVGLEAAKKIVEGQSAQTELLTQAKSAVLNGNAFFSTKPEGAPVGCRSQVFYNRLAGPCPPDSQLTWKAGLNGWESILEEPMRPCTELNRATEEGGDWFVIDVDLPEDTFKVQFVVVASNGTVDNNCARDFTLRLLDAPTEEEVLAKRIKEFERAEKERQEVVDREERKMMEQALADAETAADAAVEKLRQQNLERLTSAAERVAATRRAEWVQRLPTELSRKGVFVWATQPEGGKMAHLLYNCSTGPLRSKQGAILHMGFDGWFQNVKMEVHMQRVCMDTIKGLGLEGGTESPLFATNNQWHDFSSADKNAWDNSNGKDYHTAVVNALDRDMLAAALLEEMQSSSAEEVAAQEEHCRRLVVDKLRTKALTARRRRDRQREIVYTDPLFPAAGQELHIFYKPDRTVLNGRPEIWTRGSWNRYQHSECWTPIRLLPTSAGVLKTERKLKVPNDAVLMDLIFSDSGGMNSGFCDNNRGFDYHIPISGGTGTLQPLKIVHLSVEMAPIAKVGGMGDVVTALSRAVQEEGHDVTVILPKYDCINYSLVKNMGEEQSFHWGGSNVRVWRATVEDLDVVFLDPDNGLFRVGCIYGRNDDANRFAFFNGIATEYIARSGMNPDIVHCHDWQTAPGVFNGGPGKKVFTIHNLNYGADLIGKAIGACKVGTTVSPTYAAEICGHPVIAPHNRKMYGIINGIDTGTWSPAQDQFLPIQYGPENAFEGKAAARRSLRDRFGLCHSDVPVVAVVTRLTHQKGIHLIKHSAWRTLERGGQFVLLGSAPDPKVQAEFNALSNDLSRQYPDRARLWFAFDEPLSHLVYAGADVMLVPSMFEPCGLTQLISMSYGTVPVVRRTGGLNDSVFDVEHDEERADEAGREPNGFNFEGTDTNALDYALNRALNMWYTDREGWLQLTRTVMRQDWSWNSPALDYLEIYYKAMKE